MRLLASTLSTNAAHAVTRAHARHRDGFTWGEFALVCAEFGISQTEADRLLGKLRTWEILACGVPARAVDGGLCAGSGDVRWTWANDGLPTLCPTSTRDEAQNG